MVQATRTKDEIPWGMQYTTQQCRIFSTNANEKSSSVPWSQISLKGCNLLCHQK
jgi:hypothetical protein